MAASIFWKESISNISKFSRIWSVNISRRYQSDWEVVEKKTHTGQEWEKDDYRHVRFVDKPKQVNEQFAIELINAVPPKPVSARFIWCDGGGGPLGHPKVYINLDPEGPQSCGYCGLRFFQDNKGH